ncbi:MAG: hypothetical protein WCF67_15435, partial [Chitinophagaceae bacterium]
QNTAPDHNSPWVMPGNYTVKLIIDGLDRPNTLVVKMDPRVKTSMQDLQLQHDLSLQAYEARKEIIKLLNDNPALRNTPANSQDITFVRLTAIFGSLHDVMQDSDMPPTTQAKNAMKEAIANFQKLKQLQTNNNQ